MSYKRPIAVVVLGVLVLVSPYWIYLPLLLAALIFFPFFWEGIPLAFLADTLYAQAHEGVTLAYPLAVGVSIFLLIFMPLRRYLRLDA